MIHALDPLLADGVIDEVLTRLKSGKEADLYLVRHGDEVLAAKVYKERHARSFKNNAAYTEGRQVRNTRTQRAMDRGTRFGQKAAEEAWKTKEADALHTLHAAGVRVPRPVVFYEGVLVMEVVRDAAGHAAPRLVDAGVSRDQAAALYADLRSQAIRILTCDLVHGDLSPYNVLLGRDGPVVIDFPQVVGAAHNRQAEHFFRRDLDGLRRFFAAIDPSLQAAAGDAHEIWRAYERRELTPDFVPSGRPPPRQQPERRQQPGRGEQHRERGRP
ncbi:MAG TPA: RIO1 family regulatory kinase/ATPase, partial [Anaeromyxobacteraceae bacterium]|nr:RIO1 family regulatory kinase/ATPase [Anaeromyxobacteraceae bacterium]